MIVRARAVVTMDGAPIANGAVAVADNRITDVGGFDEVRARNSGEVVDLGEQIILPGLINAHCHLDYTCLRGKIAPAASFTDWIRAINAEKAGLSNEDYVASINAGFIEAKGFGTTTMANLTAFPELITKIETSIRTYWFAELIDVREPERATEIVDRAVDSLQAVEYGGLAPHAPYTASANLYRHADEMAHAKNFLLTTHLAESSEEMQMFVERDGALQKFLADIGRDMSDLNGVTPLARISSYCALDERWLLVHLNELTATDVDLLAQLKQKPQIVHCPRSHKYFGHSQFLFGKLQELGFNICLGTDSLASNDDLSLFAEMRALKKSDAGLSPAEILELVTVNSARALGFGGELGQLRAGFVADLIAIPSVNALKDSFDEIIAFEKSVSWMMNSGEVIAP